MALRKSGANRYQRDEKGNVDEVWEHVCKCLRRDASLIHAVIKIIFFKNSCFVSIPTKGAEFAYPG